MLSHGRKIESKILSSSRTLTRTVEPVSRYRHCFSFEKKHFYQYLPAAAAGGSLSTACHAVQSSWWDPPQAMNTPPPPPSVSSKYLPMMPLPSCYVLISFLLLLRCVSCCVSGPPGRSGAAPTDDCHPPPRRVRAARAARDRAAAPGVFEASAVSFAENSSLFLLSAVEISSLFLIGMRFAAVEDALLLHWSPTAACRLPPVIVACGCATVMGERLTCL